MMGKEGNDKDISIEKDVGRGWGWGWGYRYRIIDYKRDTLT